jgi:hypothetical protein
MSGQRQSREMVLTGEVLGNDGLLYSHRHRSSLDFSYKIRHWAYTHQVLEFRRPRMAQGLGRRSIHRQGLRPQRYQPQRLPMKSSGAIIMS